MTYLYVILDLLVISDLHSFYVHVCLELCADETYLQRYNSFFTDYEMAAE